MDTRTLLMEILLKSISFFSVLSQVVFSKIRPSALEEIIKFNQVHLIKFLIFSDMLKERTSNFEYLLFHLLRLSVACSSMYMNVT